MNTVYRIPYTVYRFSMPIISALLLILSYPRFDLEFLAWVSLIPLFFALENKNIKQRFIIGYLFGIFFFSGILYWLVNVTVPGTVVLILLLAFAPAIFTSLCRYTVYGIRYTILVPSAWVFTEYLRTHLLSGFPWALLGYSQSFNLPIIQIADMTGVYGVSFLVIFVNFGLYLVLKKTPKRLYILFFIFILFISVFLYGQNRIDRIYPTQTLRVSVIQGNIPQNIKWNPMYRNFIMDKHKSLTEESLGEGPRLVIWSETALPGYLEEKDLKNHIEDLAKLNNIYLLIGVLREENFKFFNSTTLISNKGEIVKHYNKVHLVPFGEFVPLGRYLSWIRAYIDKPVGDFDRGKEFTVFKLKLSDMIHQSDRIDRITAFYNFSSLICFEDIFPDLSRRFVKKGARFLVNVTNDAWFGRSSAPYQHAQGSIFRAVENRVPVIRAANTGVSCMIDHRGKLISIVKTDGEETFVDGYLVETIKPTFTNTLYTRFGDVFSWVCITLVFIGIVLNRVKR